MKSAASRIESLEVLATRLLQECHEAKVNLPGGFNQPAAQKGRVDQEQRQRVINGRRKFINQVVEKNNN